MSDWCTIESDPAVFTELISSFGVSDCEVEEVYSLEQMIDTSYGLVFLFKWRQESDSREQIQPELLPQLFFAKQVITNACATQAILGVLLNSEAVDIGEKLKDFRDFTISFDAEMKGEAISNSDMIKNAHNSFARPEPFHIDDSKKPGKGEAYHFVAFVPFQGGVYEMDGLKSGPIKLGEVGDASWIEVAKPAIEERMSRYSQDETSFALLSIGQMKSTRLQERIVELEHQSEALEESDTSDAADQLSMIGLEIESLRSQLAEEAQKKALQKEENARRKHNYIPFITKLIYSLAEKDKLTGLIDRVRSGSVERK